MHYTYYLRKDTVYNEEQKEYIVYGVDVTTSNGNIIQSIPDIFFDKQKAKEFVNLCNECNLSLNHLTDVIENILY